ncbi:MAG: MBL fold metallo-hydrolase [Clostridiales bacterium]|nr:MBL fold metallo-hydrolase [Clostridiales bacterium]
MSSSAKKKLYGVLVAVLVVIFAFVGDQFGLIDGLDTDSSAGNTELSGEVMTVNFFDVGQGDCKFIEFPNGECMLIDCGEKYYADRVIQKIKNAGYSKIDLLVVTHPHTDHMGGMSEIVDEFEIGEIYMSNAQAMTSTYESLLESIDNKGLTVNTAKSGVAITVSDTVTGEFLAPVSNDYDDLNNSSAVLKLTYSDVSFLFTGDAETLSENEMLSVSYYELDSDVLKVGHHGSSSSSCEEFLSAVSPEYAVIECGADNSYGHPHTETLERLENVGVKIYRTDYDSDIVFTTDGSAINVED